MKIIVSERQYKLLLGKDINPQEIDEEGDDPAAAQPTAGTSSSGSKEGYPEVGKWDSGVTRGPSNQIGVTKWSDIVGSLLKRGKGNPLK
jgi:hypothetical protein